MGGRVGHVIWSAACKFLAQHRDYFFSEQVELLQHHLQRQTGVIDEEQLALIIACVFPKTQRPIDHLLWRPHGQRGLGGELLETRAVPYTGALSK